jgi:acetyltransferase-like isoleucine patch superfamily enzyme
MYLKLTKSSSFIGSDYFLLPKVKIDNTIIVGAGSVMTQDVLDGVTVMGV